MHEARQSQPFSPAPTARRKPYQAPTIIYEAPLQAQAGSPLGNDPDPLNLTGVWR